MSPRPLLTGLSFVLFSTALASAAERVPLPAPRPWGKPVAASTTPAPTTTPVPSSPKSIPELLAAPPVQASAFAPAASPRAISSLLDHVSEGPSAPVGADAPQIKNAIALLDKGQLNEAMAIRGQLRDRAAMTLFDWLAIRAASRQVGFATIAGFLNENPDWPARALIAKRAEEALYLEDLDAGTIRTFLNGQNPQSALGQLALARISNKAEATQLVKTVWRENDLTPEIEKKVLDEFGNLLAPGDHAARADHFFYDGDVSAGMRNAQRAAPAFLAVAKARAAVIRKSKDADTLMEAVPASARHYPGYRFAQIDRLLAKDKDVEAARLMVEVPRDPAILVDERAWWEKRRWLARDMLDLGDAKMAYRVAAGHGNVRPADIADAEFHAGWIALRFLNDPATAKKHFAVITRVGLTPMTKTRGDYWMGRAEEAAGNMPAAKSYYASAAQWPTYYYGQLAGAKLGGGRAPVRVIQPSAQSRAAFDRNPAVRAIRLLYAADARDKAVPLFSETAEALRDAESLTLLGELAEKNRDPRAQLIVGKAGISNGYAVETTAWPTNGVPKFQPVGLSVEPAVVHAIARQESSFNPAAVSGANARGLLQMLPATAKRTAAKVGMPFEAARLTTDPAFNATLGAAHLGELVANYDGSYILTFVAYNAGPGRVREWVQRYGDPRDPNVDPVDWVERIPFTETRNYVQRVMENVQVYRARFGGNTAPRTIEADLRRGRG